MKTEFEFELPRGYVDSAGTVHRHGIMRLALAMDEIVPMRDIRVQDNRAYATILILARVIVRLGNIEEISPALLEQLFAGDLNYLQDFYRQINDEVKPQVSAAGAGSDSSSNSSSDNNFNNSSNSAEKGEANADKTLALSTAAL